MGKKLYIGNLPYSTTEESLTESFSKCGNVDSVKIVTDRETGRAKGFAFVEMSTDEEASAVIQEFNGKDFSGRNIIVSEARPLEQKSGGRGGFGGNRGNGGGRGGFGGGRGRRE